MDQQSPHESVAFFADSELWIAFSRLVASRSQAEVSSGIAAANETLAPSYRQHETQRGQGSHTSDLLQDLSRRVLRSCDPVDLPVVAPDQVGDASDLLD